MANDVGFAVVPARDCPGSRIVAGVTRGSWYFGSTIHLGGPPWFMSPPMVPYMVYPQMGINQVISSWKYLSDKPFMEAPK